MGVTDPALVVTESREHGGADLGGSGPDGTNLLIAYLVILFAIPARLIVGPLGTIGSPATLISMLIAFWWLWVRIRAGNEGSRGRNLVRSAGLVMIAVALLVYANCVSRPMPVLEITSADSAVLRLVALVVLALTVTDTVRGVDGFRRLTDTIVVAGATLCVLGLIQVLTGMLIVDNIVVPGLTDASNYDALALRSGRIRPVGTSTHPIELGAIMAMILPMALARARTSTTRTWLWWTISMLIALSAILSVSRTALIGCVVGVVVVATGWDLRARLTAVAAGFGLVVASAAVFPGVLGTIRGLFFNIGDDPSVASRTDSYGVAFEFVRTNPWLGRGYGTFTPEYWILDNLYLQFLIETGIVGLFALLGLIISAIVGGFRAARRTSESALAERYRGAVAAVCSGAVTLALFDAFSFPQTAGVLFLSIGLCGAAAGIASSRVNTGRT